MALKIDTDFEGWFFEKTWFFPRKNDDFEGSGGWSWHQKSMKNPLKKELNLGRPLGIDFSWILVDFGGQVEPSWHAKSSQDRSKSPWKIRWKKEGILETSWRRLGPSWAPQNPLQPLHALLPLAAAGTQRPLLRIPQDFFWYFLSISLVYTEK